MGFAKMTYTRDDKPKDSGQDRSAEIALNITRTRVTVAVFNLTIISLMLSIIKSRGATADHNAIEHLTSSTALFIGFCLTLLGIWWLLGSQNYDANGLSRPMPFALGTITTWLAISQTVTAFMHEYLVGIKSVVEASRPGVTEETQSLVQIHALGGAGLLITRGQAYC